MAESDPVEQLCKYLESPDENLLEQATEICKSQTAVPEQTKDLMKLINPLLKLTSHSNPIVSDNALVSLINMTSAEPLVTLKIIELNGVSRLLDSVIGPTPSNTSHRLMLLANLTGEPSSTHQLLDLDDDALRGQRLLRLAVRFTLPVGSEEIPRAKTLKGLPIIAENEDPYEYAAMVLMNATQSPEGRRIFFDTPDFFMPALLQQLTSDNHIRKQGITGVIRNLCFESSRHEFLLTKGNILQYIVKPLVASSFEENLSSADMLRAAFPGVTFTGEIEPIALNRRNLLETLMLLCQSEFGLKYLVDHHVVFVMREFDVFETDEENKQLSLRIAALLLGPDPTTDPTDNVHAPTETPDID